MWHCEKCMKNYSYPLGRCTKCRGNIIISQESKLIVTGITENFVPSVEHASVPYYVILLKDSNDNIFLVKSSKRYNIGEEFIAVKPSDIKIKSVGIIGAGQMGIGIAAAILSVGIPIIMRTKRSERIPEIKESVLNLARKGSPLTQDELNKNLSVTIRIEDMTNADIIIECIAENIEEKRKLFMDIERVLPESTVFATNTSSLSVTEMSAGLKHRSRVAGMHFFNPVHRMMLVEVIKGNFTSDETCQKISDLAKLMGKVPIIVRDSPGFVVNRLLIPFLNGAVELLENKVASVHEIDTAIKLGLNHPMGPFELIDLIGVDVFTEILKELNSKGGSHKIYATIQKMLDKGHLGRKTKKGFYNY